MSERDNGKPVSGKLPPEALARSILAHTGAHRAEVLIGAAVGEDAAVLRWPEGKYLVVASDPIVGASAGAGKLLVRVNANDIASKGGDPAYLMVTMILPPALGESGAARIMSEIDEECRAQGIAIVGGHTEFNAVYDHPVLMGCLIGTADRVVTAADIRPGDGIYISKHVGIEGMAIIASDRPDLFDFMSKQELAEVASWFDATSVVAESRLVRDFARFMHDPTEGGFWGGVGEIAGLAGDVVMDIDESAVPIHSLTRRAAQKLGFDPLHLIASGSLIAVIAQIDTDKMEQDPAAGVFKRIGTVRRPEECRSSPVRPMKEELWGLLSRISNKTYG